MTEAGRAVEGFLDDSALFGALPPEVRGALASRLVPVSLRGGETLTREGDEPDGLYLVRAGRLQARSGTGEDSTVHGEVGRGEVVGESALLTDQRRTASVVALRDSELLHLSVQSFESLVAEHPSFLRPVTAQVVSRMLAARHGPAGSRPASAVAVVPAHSTPLAEQVASGLADALTSCVVRSIIVGPDDQPGGRPDAGWAQTLEAENDLVVYRSDAQPGAWTSWTMRQADVVIVVVDAEEDPALTPVEELIAEHRGRVSTAVELVLAHPFHREEPSGTRRWLEHRSIRRHHHVRAGDDQHAARVARLVTNQAVGLVLSGGGARSMAEIGVLQAMVELGIPVDALGGTSAGALVAGAAARGWTPEQVRTVLYDGMVAGSNPVDLTLPLTSLAAGRRMTDRLQEAAGDIDIEDLWIDYYCVSTNLSRNVPMVHRRGRGWRAVRASMSIPGIFPPVAEDGDVLVDGGLVDNLPVDEMRRGHDGIAVVAVDVGVHRGMTADDLPDSTIVHGWQVLWDRLHPGRRSPKMAGILSILTRLTELGSRSDATDKGDVLVRPDVERFPMLDFSNFDALILVGRQAGADTLGPWWEEICREV